jgi:hypothetical protein
MFLYILFFLFLILSLTCGFVCWSPGPTESNLSGRVLVVLSCNFFTLHYFNSFLNLFCSLSRTLKVYLCSYVYLYMCIVNKCRIIFYY